MAFSFSVVIWSGVTPNNARLLNSISKVAEKKVGSSVLTVRAIPFSNNFLNG